MNTDVLWMQLKIIKNSLIVMGIIAVGSFFIFPEPKPFVTGLLFGSFINILNFRSMAIALEKAVKMNSGSASVYTSVMYMVRMIIYGIVLYISLKAPYINVLGTIIGLLLIKIVIQIENFLNLYKKR